MSVCQLGVEDFKTVEVFVGAYKYYLNVSILLSLKTFSYLFSFLSKL